MITPALQTTELPEVIKTRLEPGPTGDLSLVSEPGAGCGDQEARGIMWREAGPGSVVSRPCPALTVGVAVRACLGGGRGWGAAHLGDCRATWLAGVSDGYRGGVSAVTTTENIISQLKRGNSSLYGGDLGTLLDLMETSIKNLQLQTASSLYRQDQSKLKVRIVYCIEKNEKTFLSNQINHPH